MERDRTSSAYPATLDDEHALSGAERMISSLLGLDHGHDVAE